MTSDDTLGVADIREILRLLPHRFPFLLIDRVIDIRGDQHGIGIKNLTLNEPFLARSAENLVIPGVLVIEGLAQTAGIQLYSSVVRDTCPQHPTGNPEAPLGRSYADGHGQRAALLGPRANRLTQ
jgi:predicted hotdog family 3-hydroxylacyl-ACP dehydratase